MSTDTARSRLTRRPHSRDKILDLEEIQRYWHDAAPWYDGDLSGADYAGIARSPTELRAWELLLRRTIGPPPLRVLDVGTGTGKISILLSSLGYQVTAIDAVERMLDITRHKAEQAGLSITLIRALAADLPFETGSFDAVTSRLVLWTQPEPERTVAAWARVTRPGGRIITVESLHGQRKSASHWARHRMASAILRLRGKREGFLDDYERLAQLPLGRVYKPEAYRNVFIRAGLQRVLIEELHGIRALPRRRTPLCHRLWPRGTPILIEGTVPNDSQRPGWGNSE